MKPDVKLRGKYNKLTSRLKNLQDKISLTRNEKNKSYGDRWDVLDKRLKVLEYYEQQLLTSICKTDRELEPFKGKEEPEEEDTTESPVDFLADATIYGVLTGTGKKVNKTKFNLPTSPHFLKFIDRYGNMCIANYSDIKDVRYSAVKGERYIGIVYTQGKIEVSKLSPVPKGTSIMDIYDKIADIEGNMKRDIEDYTLEWPKKNKEYNLYFKCMDGIEVEIALRRILSVKTKQLSCDKRYNFYIEVAYKDDKSYTRYWDIPFPRGMPKERVESRRQDIIDAALYETHDLKIQNY